jgi:hypothetical protein
MGVLAFTPGIEIASAQRPASLFREAKGGYLWLKKCSRLPNNKVSSAYPYGTKTVGIGHAPLVPNVGLFSNSALDWQRIN